MNRTLFRIGDADVTPREIGVSIIILFLMLSVGGLITNKIREYNKDKYIRIEEALKITDEEMYNHAINTKVGDVLAYGTFKAISPIKNNRIDGVYSYIKEVEEHYVMKTRTVTYSCNCNSKGQCQTCTKTEVYWEWDEVNKTINYSPTISFLGNEYSYNLFDNYPENYLDTIKTSRTVRFKYYAVPQSFSAGILVNTSTGYIKPFNGETIQLYVDMTPEKIIESEKGNLIVIIIVFWFIWLIFISATIYGYVSLENKYLY